MEMKLLARYAIYVNSLIRYFKATYLVGQTNFEIDTYLGLSGAYAMVIITGGCMEYRACGFVQNNFMCVYVSRYS